MFQRVVALLLLLPAWGASDEAIRGFISVESFELRLEAIVKVEPFRESWRLEEDGIRREQKQPILDNMATLFESGVNLSAPGQEILFSGRTIRFVVPDPATGYRPDERELIPIEEALVGITMSSSVEKVRQLSGEWLWFAPGQEELVLEIASRARPSARLLKPNDAAFEWRLDSSVALPEMIELPEVARRSSRPLRHLIWIALVLLATAAVVVVRKKQESPAWVGWLTVLGMGLGIASVQVKGEEPTVPESAETGELIYGSLRNIYHAFDFRDESSIYDTLEKTVTGSLLEEVYLEIRRSLELETMGGPSVKVYEIALRDWEPRGGEAVDLEGGGFPVLARWATIGEVTHWGHTHERTNRYEAEIAFRIVENRWMVSELELLNEERVQKVSRRKALPPEMEDQEKEP
ncbi:MAG: hypothetical protein AAF491_06135 [Verrucomicrobiota bacterium]